MISNVTGRHLQLPLVQCASKFSYRGHHRPVVVIAAVGVVLHRHCHRHGGCVLTVVVWSPCPGRLHPHCRSRCGGTLLHCPRLIIVVVVVVGTLFRHLYSRRCHGGGGTVVSPPLSSSLPSWWPCCRCRYGGGGDNVGHAVVLLLACHCGECAMVSLSSSSL